MLIFYFLIVFSLMYQLYLNKEGSQKQLVSRFYRSNIRGYVGAIALSVFNAYKRYYASDPKYSSVWSDAKWEQCKLYEEKDNGATLVEVPIPLYWEDGTLNIPIFDTFKLDLILASDTSNESNTSNGSKEAVVVSEAPPVPLETTEAVIPTESKPKKVKNSYNTNTPIAIVSTGDPHMDELLRRVEIQRLKNNNKILTN